MDPLPVRCLLNSISRYLHLVACQTVRYNPIQTCIGNVVLLLKLLKPLLDEVVDCKIPSDGGFDKACEDLDSVVNQAREFLEDWSPKLSKLFGVFQCEVLVGKVQTCSLEIGRILRQLSQSSPQSSPATSNIQGVETRRVLTHQELIPNYTVKGMIASWLEANNINLAANSGHQYDRDNDSSMANNMGSQDFNRTESFRFSLRSSSFTSRSSLENGNGFEKLKINISPGLCAESQSKDLDIFELLSSGQSYTHSWSESVCSVVSSVDYVPSVTHVTESFPGNQQSSTEMSPKKNSECSSNGNNEYRATKTYECSLQDLDDSGTLTTSYTEKLVEDLKSGSNQVKTAAAAELLHLTIKNIENRVLIERCGAITPLLSLLYSEDMITQEHAVTALQNLLICELNKAVIVEAGVIEPLVHVLNTGNDRAKENSAATLFSLSVLQVNREQVGQSNAAIQALVNLLGKGTFRGKKDAASALFNLSITHENKARIVQAKAVKYLVKLLNPDLEMVDKAVALLATLSAVGDGRQAIVREGEIPLLVETVDSGSRRV